MVATRNGDEDHRENGDAGHNFGLLMLLLLVYKTNSSYAKRRAVLPDR